MKFSVDNRKIIEILEEYVDRLVEDKLDELSNKVSTIMLKMEIMEMLGFNIETSWSTLVESGKDDGIMLHYMIVAIKFGSSISKTRFVAKTLLLDNTEDYFLDELHRIHHPQADKIKKFVEQRL